MGSPQLSAKASCRRAGHPALGGSAGTGWDQTDPEVTSNLNRAVIP